MGGREARYLAKLQFAQRACCRSGTQNKQESILRNPIVASARAGNKRRASNISLSRQQQSIPHAANCLSRRKSGALENSHLPGSFIQPAMNILQPPHNSRKPETMCHLHLRQGISISFRVSARTHSAAQQKSNFQLPYINANLQNDTSAQ